MALLHEGSSVSTSWMEHQILEHIKQALRVTLEWQAPVVSLPRKLSSLQFTMKSFQRHMERVMSIEEEGGYMREVLETKPNLQNHIERLAKEHNQFRARIRELLPELNSMTDWDEERYNHVSDELRNLLEDIDRHDMAEIELLEDSLWIDEGGEG